LAPTAWKDQMRVGLLAHGAKQPFYHVSKEPLCSSILSDILLQIHRFY